MCGPENFTYVCARRSRQHEKRAPMNSIGNWREVWGLAWQKVYVWDGSEDAPEEANAPNASASASDVDESASASWAPPSSHHDITKDMHNGEQVVQEPPGLERDQSGICFRIDGAASDPKRFGSSDRHGDVLPAYHCPGPDAQQRARCNGHQPIDTMSPFFKIDRRVDPHTGRGATWSEFATRYEDNAMEMWNAAAIDPNAARDWEVMMSSVFCNRVVFRQGHPDRGQQSRLAKAIAVEPAIPGWDLNLPVTEPVSEGV